MAQYVQQFLKDPVKTEASGWETSQQPMHI